MLLEIISSFVKIIKKNNQQTGDFNQMYFSSDGESYYFLSDDELNNYIDTGPIDHFFDFEHSSSDKNKNVEQIEQNKAKESKNISKQEHERLQINSFFGKDTTLSKVEKYHFPKKNEVIEFISNEVLVGQHKKFTRNDKIIVFQIIQKYSLMLYPNNIGIIKELTRNEKRKTEFLERRFQYHSSIIYSIFQTPFKKEICLKILQSINQMAISKLEKEILITNDETLIAKKKEFITAYKAELDEISKQFGL